MISIYEITYVRLFSVFALGLFLSTFAACSKSAIQPKSTGQASPSQDSSTSDNQSLYSTSNQAQAVSSVSTATQTMQYASVSELSSVNQQINNLQTQQSAFTSLTDKFASAISALETKVADLFNKSTLLEYRLNRGNLGGSTFIRWGNKNALPGTEIVYQGNGYGSYYGHARNRDAECLAGGDRGDAQANGDASDVMYQLVTGLKAYLPTPIPEYKPIVCAVLFVSSPTVVIKGKSSCPANWSKLYSGYMMSGYYNHAGGISNTLCMDDQNFDASGTAAGIGATSYIYGSNTLAGNLGAEYPDYKWLKCAVCSRN